MPPVGTRGEHRQRLLPACPMLWLVLALLLSPSRTAAQAAPPEPRLEGRYAFASYGAKQGLENLSVWAIEQDPEGFLWVGTAAGLYRYDGLRFTAYKTDQGLPSTWIRTVYSAPTGELYVGTLLGVAVRNGPVFRALGPEVGLPAIEVYALEQDGAGRLWVGTDEGLYRSVHGHRFSRVPGWPAHTMARALREDQNGMIVAGNATLYHVAFSDDEVRAIDDFGERLEAIASDHEGRLWVRGRNRLFLRRSVGASFEDLSHRMPATAFFDATIRVDAEGVVWMPSSEGLARIQDDEFGVLGAAQGLPTPWANRVMTDREGSLWIGSAGLYRVLGRGVWRQYTHKQGLPGGGVVWNLMRDREGRTWAGTTQGLYRFTHNGWQLVERTRGQVVIGLVQDTAGGLWIGEGGTPPLLHRWQVETDEWTSLDAPRTTINGLTLDPDGSLWVSTRRSGLHRVVQDGARYRVEAVPLPGGGDDERTEAMSLGAGGKRLWVAAARGLALREDGRWRRFGVRDGLRHEHVVSVLERADGQLWVSYLEPLGLSRFRYEGGSLVAVDHLDSRRGLASDQVSFVRQDVRGRLWIGTGLGVHLLDGSQLEHFGVADGLPGDDCTGGAFLAEPNGDVWIGTTAGLGKFVAASHKGSDPAPDALLLSVQVGGETLRAPFPPDREVDRDASTVEFRFSGMTFVHEADVTHQVRLVGLETTWRDTDVRQARYAALAPGAYRFEVRAGLGDGRWGGVDSYSFRVRPAWWQHWLIPCLLASLGFGVIALLVRLRVALLRRRNRELELQVAARTEELARANEALQQLTVTDELTGLKNRRYLDMTMEADVGQTLRVYESHRRANAEGLPGNADMLFALIDLDHFKYVNDTFGHSAGDQVLRQVRDRLLRAVRATDTVTRWGGEEFLVVARHVDRGSVHLLAERICRAMREEPFHVGKKQKLVRTCSVGFVAFPVLQEEPASVSWQTAVELADKCLYAAKRSGRNAWVGFDGRELQPEDVTALLAGTMGDRTRSLRAVLTSFKGPVVWQ